jgi:hypothetical protein
MKKAKPVKGSARTRKFARGGDIAALAGLGTLAYLLSRKKDKEKGEGGLKTSNDKADKVMALAEKVSADERIPASKGTSEEPPEPEKSKVYKAEPGTGTARAAKPVASMSKRVVSAAKPVAKASDKVGAGYEGLDLRQKESVPNAQRPSKPYPANAKGTEKDPYLSGMGPKNTFLTKERLDQSKEAMRRYREEELKKKRGVAEIKYDEMGNPMKKGGVVKKYAAGGTATAKPEPKKAEPTGLALEAANIKKDQKVKKEAAGAEKEVKRNMSTFGFSKGGSASSRADGCAIRGKTRGKVY